MKHFKETLYDAVCQEFRIDKLYFENRTNYQHLMIFHNARLGRVMTLDGIVQTTEADEFIYHEMLAHVPLFSHGQAKRVLIIGGGDGAMLREVLRHPVEEVTLVEIDQTVIDIAKQYLPNHSAGAFEDSRTRLVISDGLQYVRTTDERFDVIISDSTDPIGPGEVLFSESFYAQSKRCLAPGGVLVTQNGVPFFQPDELKVSARRMKPHFADATFYCAPVPSYYGGFMAFGWGTDDIRLRQTDMATLQSRYEMASIKMRYYNPEIHRASFALPQYMLDALSGAN
jgi:spermidine synthase